MAGNMNFSERSSIACVSVALKTNSIRDIRKMKDPCKSIAGKIDLPSWKEESSSTSLLMIPIECIAEQIDWTSQDNNEFRKCGKINKINYFNCIREKAQVVSQSVQ